MLWIRNYSKFLKMFNKHIASIFKTTPGEKRGQDFDGPDQWGKWEDEEVGKKYLPSEFCMESSLHGLRFIGQPKRHLVERIFWALAFIVAVIVSIILISQIWDKYKKTPVITVFQPYETGIDRLPFPAVTICNTNNVVKAKAEEFLRNVEENPLDPTANVNLLILHHLCETATSFAQVFNFSLTHGNIGNHLKDKLQNVDEAETQIMSSKNKITDLLQDVAQKCSDMILLCLWENEEQDCNDLFDEVETDFGYCCSFNLIPQSLLLSLRKGRADDEYKVKEWKALDLDMDNLILDDDGESHGSFQLDQQYEFNMNDDEESDEKENEKKFPYRQKRPGKTTGLSILLDPDLESYFCTNTDSVGFMVNAESPLDYPRVADEGVAIKPNSETYLKIKPEVTVPDEEIRDIPLEKRNCYFGKEYSLKYYNYYTTSNCENECVANLTLEQCGCVLYFMPRGENQGICGTSEKYKCSENVTKHLMKEGLRKICRKCLPTCTEIEYHMSSSYMPLRENFPLWNYLNGTPAAWAHKNVSILHVHFSVDSTYPKMRKELYGFIDLLSNTGGLLGLCLGFSALSLLEIFYFLTLRLYCKTKRGRILGEKLTNSTQDLWKKTVSLAMRKFRKGQNPMTTQGTRGKEEFDCEYGERMLQQVLQNRKNPFVIRTDNLNRIQIASQKIHYSP